MKTRGSPFAWVDGQPYLIVNFTLPPDDRIPLPDLLTRLLCRAGEDDLLLLRPLEASEAQILKQARRESEAEAWAQIVAKEENVK